MRTMQEAFDFVATKMIEQGVRSYNNNTCLYRGLDGLMCAAGCQIPNEKYKPEMEENNISAVLSQYPGLQDDLFFSDADADKSTYLQMAMQEAHDYGLPIDKGESLDYYKAKMRDIAQNFDLKVNFE